jgi:hypothetical protein
MRADGTALRAQLPCRPAAHARQVDLLDQRRVWHLLSCTAADATWALAWVDGVAPADVPRLLRLLRDRAASNLGSQPVEVVPAHVSGATPHPESGRFRLLGRRPDGTTVVQEQAVFAYGTTVFQVTVLASRDHPQAFEMFFEALKIEP